MQPWRLCVVLVACVCVSHSQTLTAISPSVGHPGTLVTAVSPTMYVVGGVDYTGTSRFDFKLRCRFGDVVVSAKLFNTTAVRCTAPAPSSGLSNQTSQFSVSVDLPWEDFGTNGWLLFNGVFQYYPLPTVSSIFPSASELGYSVKVTVTGTGFQPLPKLRCSFTHLATTAASTGAPTTAGSNTPATTPALTSPAAYISSTSLVCVSPKAVAVSQKLAVSVSLNAVDYSQDKGVVLSVYPSPTVFYATPMRSYIRGGTLLTVHGTGFSGGTDLRCRFGDKVVFASGPIAIPNSAQESFTCAIPSAYEGPLGLLVQLTVSLNGQHYFWIDDQPAQFRYYDDAVDLRLSLLVFNESDVRLEGFAVPRVADVVGVPERRFIQQSYVSNGFGEYSGLNGTLIDVSLKILDSPVVISARDISGDIISRSVYNSYGLQTNEFRVMAATASPLPFFVFGVVPAKSSTAGQVSLSVFGANIQDSSAHNVRCMLVPVVQTGGQKRVIVQGRREIGSTGMVVCRITFEVVQGAYQVEVTSNGVDYTNSKPPVYFTYYAPPTVNLTTIANNIASPVATLTAPSELLARGALVLCRMTGVVDTSMAVVLGDFNRTAVVCKFPPQEGAKQVQFALSFNSGILWHNATTVVSLVTKETGDDSDGSATPAPLSQDVSAAGSLAPVKFFVLFLLVVLLGR